MTTGALNRYLGRIGLGERPEATLAGLQVVHRAHVARIPYDNLSIILGRPDPEGQAASVDRVVRGGRLGYCFQQNGALEWLLTGLGFSVSRRHGHVWFSPEGERDSDLNHLVLVVSGLPTPDHPGGHWWADVGLGDGFAEALPLVAGEHVVDGWAFGIVPGPGLGDAAPPEGPAGWSYRHAPGSVIVGIAASSRDHSAEAIAEAHHTLSRGAGSPFRRTLIVERLDGPTRHAVRGLVHHLTTPETHEERDLSSFEEWRSALADDLLLAVDDVTDDEWAALWRRTVAAHRAWEDAGRP